MDLDTRRSWPEGGGEEIHETGGAGTYQDRPSPEEIRADTAPQYIHIGDGQKGPGGTGIIQEDVPFSIGGNEPTLPLQSAAGTESNPGNREAPLLEKEPNPQGQDP